jgi:hypothetical protein
MRNHIRIALAILLLGPLASTSFAAVDSECKAFPFRGTVRTVQITTERVNRTNGLSVGPSTKEAEITVSEDRRTMTSVRFSADTLTAARRSLFPTTISQFDEAGRLVRQSLTVEGRENFSVIECAYDQLGRVRSSTKRSRNPEQNQSVTFEYLPSTIRERFKTAVASLLISHSLDTEGRVVKEVEFDEFRNVTNRTREFTHSGRSSTMCTNGEDGKRVCRTTVTDANGNEVEIRTGAIVQKIQFEYDNAGNWVSKRTDGGFESLTNDIIERRSITYW